MLLKFSQFINENIAIDITRGELSNILNILRDEGCIVTTDIEMPFDENFNFELNITISQDNTNDISRHITSVVDRINHLQKWDAQEVKGDLGRHLAPSSMANPIKVTRITSSIIYETVSMNLNDNFMKTLLSEVIYSAPDGSKLKDIDTSNNMVFNHGAYLELQNVDVEVVDYDNEMYDEEEQQFQITYYYKEGHHDSYLPVEEFSDWIYPDDVPGEWDDFKLNFDGYVLIPEGLKTLQRLE
jgi:hypothetical protein